MAAVSSRPTKIRRSTRCSEPAIVGFLRFPACPTSFGLAMVRLAVDYSRWEIGEEPQQLQKSGVILPIIADGRSGRNRNRR